MINVGIVMGSDSDLPVMTDTAKILEKLGIGYEIRVLSAHRTPENAVEFARTARERGLSTIIAGAGGAAHLAGIIAAHTTLPVIGVPIKSAALSGVDSLYSIVQMPSGIPVACVAINGAQNAGLLAAQIISVKDAEVCRKLEEHKETMKKTVLNKDAELQNIGYKKYMENQIN